jgi:hypothetical protein
MVAQEQQAFILRIAPSEIDHVAEALEQNQLIIGWADAEGLLDPNLIGRSSAMSSALLTIRTSPIFDGLVLPPVTCGALSEI